MPPAERKITSTSTPYRKALWSQLSSVSVVSKPAASSTSSTRRASSARTNRSTSSVVRGRPKVTLPSPPPCVGVGVTQRRADRRAVVDVLRLALELGLAAAEVDRGGRRAGERTAQRGDPQPPAQAQVAPLDEPDREEQNRSHQGPQHDADEPALQLGVCEQPQAVPGLRGLLLLFVAEEVPLVRVGLSPAGVLAFARLRTGPLVDGLFSLVQPLRS